MNAMHLAPLTASSPTNQLSPAEDSSDISPRRAARSFKNRFIEVYIGSEVIADAGLNVIIAVYLQAIDRLYEVVVINSDTAEEISHFFVFEDELSAQMKSRREALTFARDTHAAWAAARMAPIDLAHPGELALGSSSDSIATVASTSEKHKLSPKKNTFRRKSSGDLQSKLADLAHSAQQLSCRRRKSFVPVSNSFQRHKKQVPEKSVNVQQNRRKSIEGLHHELFGHTLELRTLLGSTAKQDSAILRELELINLLAGDDSLAHNPVSVSDPVAYFRLMAGSQLDPEVGTFKKIERAELLKDYSLLEADMSTSPVQDIAFYTAVILNSLYVRYRARRGENSELQVLLFDGND